MVSAEKREPNLPALLKILEEMEMKSTVIEARTRYTQTELF